MKLPSGPGAPAPDIDASRQRRHQRLPCGVVDHRGDRRERIGGRPPPPRPPASPASRLPRRRGWKRLRSASRSSSCVARAGDATLLLTRENRILEHGRADEILEAVAGIPLDACRSPDDARRMPAAVRQRGPRLEGGTVQVPRVRSATTGGSSPKVRARRTSTANRAQRPWRLVASVRRDPGRPAWRVEYRDFENNLPQTIRDEQHRFVAIRSASGAVAGRAQRARCRPLRSKSRFRPSADPITHPGTATKRPAGSRGRRAAHARVDARGRQTCPGVREDQPHAARAGRAPGRLSRAQHHVSDHCASRHPDLHHGARAVRDSLQRSGVSRRSDQPRVAGGRGSVARGQTARRAAKAFACASTSAFRCRPASAEAAATRRRALMVLPKLWRVRISAARLARIAATLGADVPFFLRAAPPSARPRRSAAADGGPAARGGSCSCVPGLRRQHQGRLRLVGSRTCRRGRGLSRCRPRGGCRWRSGAATMCATIWSRWSRSAIRRSGRSSAESEAGRGGPRGDVGKRLGGLRAVLDPARRAERDRGARGRASPADDPHANAEPRAVSGARASLAASVSVGIRASQ